MHRSGPAGTGRSGGAGASLRRLTRHPIGSQEAGCQRLEHVADMRHLPYRRRNGLGGSACAITAGSAAARRSRPSPDCVEHHRFSGGRISLQITALSARHFHRQGRGPDHGYKADHQRPGGRRDFRTDLRAPRSLYRCRSQHRAGLRYRRRQGGGRCRLGRLSRLVEDGTRRTARASLQGCRCHGRQGA